MDEARFRPPVEGSAITVLHAQHDRIRELLAEVRGAEGEHEDERRRQAFETLRELLAAHETAEEIVLRPVSVQVMNRDATAARTQRFPRHGRRLTACRSREAFLRSGT